MSTLLLSLLLSGCNGAEKPGEGAEACADGQPAPTWYADADGDGYGDSTSGASACEQPEGTAADGTDCDDTDAGVSPAEAEICDSDGVDEDCDGLVNDEDDSLPDSEKQDWMVDADGDGFGTGRVVVTACDPGDGYSTTDDDCDDTSAAVHPGHSEVCSDGLDNDCDGDAGSCGTVGEVEVTTDDADGYLYSPQSGTYLGGDGAISHGDFDGDGKSDVVLGGSEYGYVGYGGAWIFEGPASGATSTERADVIVSNDNAYFFFGSSVLGGYDGNRDGDEDLVVGASGFDGVLMFEGPLARTENANAAWGYFNAPSGFGDMLATAELDGDGDADLLMPSNDVLYGIAGTLGNDGPEGDSPTLEVTVGMPDVLEAFDSDGDGLDELALGGSSDGDGVVLVLPGGQSGAYTATDVAWVVGASDSGTRVYSTIATGDVDQDGYEDLVVQASDTGTWVGVITGPIAGDRYVEDAAGRITPATGEGIGDFKVLDDFTGDGVPDLTFNTSGSSDLEIRVVAGPLNRDISTADAVTKLYDTSSDRTDGVWGVGDLDGDGTEDIAIVQSQGDPYGEDEAGHVYLYLGGGL